MVHRQIQSSSFGRLALPFLLLFLLIYVDARVIRCRDGGCVNAAPSARPLALGQELPANLPQVPLTFPFSESFLNGQPAPVEPPEQVPVGSALPAPVRAGSAPSAFRSTRTNSAVPTSDNGAVAPPRLPTDREVTSADVDAFVLQAQRYFRSQQTGRANGTHPMAGGSGSPNNADGTAPGQSRPSNTGAPSGQGGPAANDAPPEPPPGQGDPGGTAPGALGEPAGGFLG